MAVSGTDTGTETEGVSGSGGRWTQNVADAVFLPSASAVVLRLTLLVLILHGSSAVGLEVLLMVFCGSMLVFPAFLESRVLWLAVCGCVWWLNGIDWLWIDNHKYLMSYWCLACALAVQSRNTGEVLRHNAVVLVGLSFLFATVWKMAAGEYLDGSFFYFTLLTDSRLETLAVLFGGADLKDLAQATMMVDTLTEFPGEGAELTLPMVAGLKKFALIGSWWTLVVEGGVALAFLIRWKGGRLSMGLGDVLLITFVVTTYVFIPVMGFGSILVVLGLAACSDERRKTRVAYLLLFALLQLTQLPWQDWVT